MKTLNRAAAVVCLVLISVAVWYFVQAERAFILLENQTAATIQGAPDELVAAVHAEGDSTRAMITAQIAAGLSRVDASLLRVDRTLDLAGSAEQDASSQISGIRSDVRGMGDQLVGALNAQGDHANASVAALQTSASSFLATYQALPSEFQASPAWLSLGPEITCRQLNGAGYGGCMRARINGLLGEAERTGAAFTAAAPRFVDAGTGIAIDVHKFTTKATAPPTIKGRIWEVLKLGSYVAGKAIP